MSKLPYYAFNVVQSDLSMYEQSFQETGLTCPVLVPENLTTPEFTELVENIEKFYEDGSSCRDITDTLVFQTETRDIQNVHLLFVWMVLQELGVKLRKDDFLDKARSLQTFRAKYISRIK